MAKFAPHYNLFKKIERLNYVNQWAFWLILFLSILPAIFNEFFNKYSLTHIINILNIIGISLYFIIDTTVNYILLPIANNRRRDDFIDNSFGSVISTDNSISYFDNDNVDQGLYKAAVNLFENCFFTYSLVRAMTIRKIIIPSIALILITIFTYIGLKESPFTLIILQALFSTNILGTLIKHLILTNRLSTIQDSWISLFNNKDIKSDTYKYQPYVFRYWLQYETLNSKINPNISNKIFEKCNPTLTNDWNKLKQRYIIN